MWGSLRPSVPSTKVVISLVQCFLRCPRLRLSCRFISAIMESSIHWLEFLARTCCICLMLGTSVAQMWAGQVAHFIDPNNAKTLSLPGGCSRWTRSCCNQPGYQYLPGEFCGPLRPDGGYSKRDTGVSGFVSHSSATSFPRVCLFWINATVFV